LKIDTTLPNGTLYIRNDTAEGIELVFGKIHEDKLECHRKWLHERIEEENEMRKRYYSNKDYDGAADCHIRITVLEGCLLQLNKRD
jgi:hypothetical protein